MFDIRQPRKKLPRDFTPPEGYQRFFKPKVPEITHETKTLGCMIFSFRDSLSKPQRDRLEALLWNDEGGEDIGDISWSVGGNLTINLKPAKRFVHDPKMRANARIDMPGIVKRAYDTMRRE